MVARRISCGEMVGCDNEDCALEWFHYSCVGISLSQEVCICVYFFDLIEIIIIMTSFIINVLSVFNTECRFLKPGTVLNAQQLQSSAVTFLQ